MSRGGDPRIDGDRSFRFEFNAAATVNSSGLRSKCGPDLGTAAGVDLQKERNMLGFCSNRIRFCSAAALCLAAAGLVNSAAAADDRHRGHSEYGYGKRAHIEALATDLYKQSSAICWEMHRYYQHNANFKSTYKGMYQIHEGAERIANLSKSGYYRSQHSNDRLAAELHRLDSLFDDIDAEVRRWRSNRRDGSRGRDLAGMMDECEETLDHFMEDYGIRSKIRKDHVRYGGRPSDRDRGPRRY